MRVAATPREVMDWQRELAPLPPDRVEAVVVLLAEVVGHCPICEEPVRRCDLRVADDAGHLLHVSCAGRCYARSAA